jgi:hypothetical protein
MNKMLTSPHTALASVRVATSFVPRVWFWAATYGAYMNVDIHRNCMDMAIDRLAGEGTESIDPNEFKTPGYTSKPAFRHSVVLSWPVHDTDNAVKQHALPGQHAVITLDSVLKESSNTVYTTRPFYILDGGGGRMGSLCVVKSLLKTQRLCDELPENLSFEPSWLNHYSTIHRAQAAA